MHLKGKKGIILGIANQKSIAWGCAKALKEAGADFGVTFLNQALEKRVRPLATEISADFVVECDATNNQHLDRLAAKAQEIYGEIDFIIHSVAYANKEALSHPVSHCSKENFLEAMSISAWSLLGICGALKDIMTPGGSVVTMTYYGSTKVIQNYGIMGVAKAALEAEVRYLAEELGEKSIRVNALSAGPIRTLAAAGIKGFKGHLEEVAQRSAIKKNVSIEEVGSSCKFLISDSSLGITGQVIYVDQGFSTLG